MTLIIRLFPSHDEVIKALDHAGQQPDVKVDVWNRETHHPDGTHVLFRRLLRDDDKRSLVGYRPHGVEIQPGVDRSLAEYVVANCKPNIALWV